MTGKAAIRQVEAFAIGGIARAGRPAPPLPPDSCQTPLRPRTANFLRTFIAKTPQRGSVTTSTTAGPPALTAAMARLSAGARSLGSVIGPSPWAPRPRETVRVVDVWILERGADIHLLDVAAMPRRHRHQVHVFLVVGAIVLNDVEDRDLVVRGRPHGARAEHEVAIATKGERETAVLLVGQRRANRGWQVIADAGAARHAIPLMRLLEVPQPMHPAEAGSRCRPPTSPRP